MVSEYAAPVDWVQFPSQTPPHIAMANHQTVFLPSSLYLVIGTDVKQNERGGG